MISGVQTVGYLSPVVNSIGAPSIAATGHIGLTEASVPQTSLDASQVAQYSKSVYSVLLNGLVARLGGTSVGGSIAQENLVGPFANPPAPAGSVAGIPIAPGADHNEYAAQVMASLRSLAGNGQIFQTDGSKKS
ncbi:MAG: hypothetical protein ABSE64_04600 [Vulcanimicrobiaceae bacterium]|jgi:hypothetical protein